MYCTVIVVITRASDKVNSRQCILQDTKHKVGETSFYGLNISAYAVAVGGGGDGGGGARWRRWRCGCSRRAQHQGSEDVDQTEAHIRGAVAAVL
jgi:hypothetical protein